MLEVSLLDIRISKDLTGMRFSDIVLEFLSFVAETERKFIRIRKKEGIAAAKARVFGLARNPEKNRRVSVGVLSNGKQEIFQRVQRQKKEAFVTKPSCGGLERTKSNKTAFRSA